MLRDYLDKYSVSLKKKKNSNKISNIKKNAIEVGGAQINPNLAVCHIINKMKKNIEKNIALKSRNVVRTTLLVCSLLCLGSTRW